MRFSDQVFEELQMQPQSPTPSTSYRPQTPSLIYENGGIITRKHAKSNSQSHFNSDQNLSRYALQKRLDAQHSLRSRRQTGTSSEAESDGSLRFHSISTTPSSPPLLRSIPLSKSTESNSTHPKSSSEIIGRLNIPDHHPKPSTNSRSFSRASFRSISSI
ncbi:uncharacterized protein MELLADRAFT_114910, partial [Melampsora larici-populina 98AG31]